MNPTAFDTVHTLAKTYGPNALAQALDVCAERLDENNVRICVVGYGATVRRALRLLAPALAPTCATAMEYVPVAAERGSRATGVEICAIDLGTAAGDFLGNVLCADEVVIALDALALLSLEEKRLARELSTRCAATFRSCVLVNVQLLDDAEREEVDGLLRDALPGIAVLDTSAQGGAQAAYASWAKLAERACDTRREVATTCALDLLEERVVAKKEAGQLDSERLTGLLKSLDAAESAIQVDVAASTRMVQTHFITPMGLLAERAVGDFAQKAKEDLARGIDEEPDVAALEEALPYYLQDVWEEFVERELAPLLGEEASSFQAVLEDDVESRVTRELVRFLTKDQMAAVLDLMDRGVDPLGANSSKALGVGFVDDSAAQDEQSLGDRLGDAVPALLGVAGGVALLTGFGVLVAGALAITGWKVRSMRSATKRSQLLGEACALSTTYCKHVEQVVAGVLADAEKHAREHVAKAYAGVFQTIRSMADRARTEEEALRNQMDELERALVILKTME